jgi:hypothetical protein
MEGLELTVGAAVTDGNGKALSGCESLTLAREHAQTGQTWWWRGSAARDARKRARVRRPRECRVSRACNVG